MSGRWTDPIYREQYVPEDQLVAWLDRLAHDPFEQSSNRKAAFLQAADRIRELEGLVVAMAMGPSLKGF